MKTLPPRKFATYLFVFGLAFVMLYPLLWMFSASLTPGGMIGSAGLIPPRGVTADSLSIRSWSADSLSLAI